MATACFTGLPERTSEAMLRSKQFWEAQYLSGMAREWLIDLRKVVSEELYLRD